MVLKFSKTVLASNHTERRVSRMGSEAQRKTRLSQGHGLATDRNRPGAVIRHRNGSMAGYRVEPSPDRTTNTQKFGRNGRSMRPIKKFPVRAVLVEGIMRG